MGGADESFEQRLERAKLAAMKELAYGASHEINNPLANISARAQMLLRDERDSERRRALEAINQQALRAHEMISDLMLFARPPRMERQAVDVQSLVERAIAHVKRDCDRRGIRINVIWSAACSFISGDAIQLEVALNSLLANSIEAIGEHGVIEVRVDGVEAHSPMLRLTVCDDGPGIQPNAREHLFDPFFSGREAGRGLGFGLSKACRIVTEHGGRLRSESAENAGARFIIELPMSTAD